MGKATGRVKPPPRESLLDTAAVLDQRKSEWNDAYDTRYKRVQVVTFLDKKVFDDVAGTWTSDEFFCAPYSKFCFLNNVAWTLTPTSLQLYIEVSDDAINWYQKMDGPFGSYMYVPAQGAIKDSVEGIINSTWVRVRAVVVGSSAVNKCTLTSKITFVT